MKKILLSILFCILISCESSDKLETIYVNDYKIDLPTYLSKSSQLNEDASLQFQNLFKELYIIVIDETKEEFNKALMENGIENMFSKDFDGYVKLLSTNLQNNVEMKHKKEKDTLINGMRTKLIMFDGKSEGYDIYYQVAYVEGNEKYYQLMTWTLLDKKDEHENIMNKMVSSFNLRNNKKTSQIKRAKSK
ncbi:conserved hypothetical protein [Flavobacterium sp. 9AF]|uniref:hypothetical protein n=1 Tax=Flavobacterium sp. 9AF TaxID=2653142 RepID=UPI0012EFFE88|nr:hypothetical protein [Flavobacterium sp. 9AF]VXA92612.1 conserved hypothetical protein [Flavobacterium sp. 9AF]